MLFDHLGDFLVILHGEEATGGVAGGVEDDHLGAVGYPLF